MGEKGRPVVMWSDSLPWAVQRLPNRLRWHLGVAKEACIGGMHTGATWRILMNCPCSAAMRPVINLLWPLVEDIVTHTLLPVWEIKQISKDVQANDPDTDYQNCNRPCWFRHNVDILSLVRRQVETCCQNKIYLLAYKWIHCIWLLVSLRHLNQFAPWKRPLNHGIDVHDTVSNRLSLSSRHKIVSYACLVPSRYFLKQSLQNEDIFEVTLSNILFTGTILSCRIKSEPFSNLFVSAFVASN